eukprot:4729667-Prorocentrum_lima.AAC.1
MAFETRAVSEHTKTKGAHRRSGEGSKRVLKLMLQASVAHQTRHGLTSLATLRTRKHGSSNLGEESKL